MEKVVGRNMPVDQASTDLKCTEEGGTGSWLCPSAVRLIVVEGLEMTDMSMRNCLSSNIGVKA